MAKGHESIKLFCTNFVHWETIATIYIDIFFVITLYYVRLSFEYKNNKE